MQPIDLDLSPLLINRTAVLTIGRDVCRILEESRDYAVRYRFFGRLERDWPDEARSRQLLALMDEARAAAGAGRLRDWMPPRDGAVPAGGNPAARAFLLDPLYALFAPLSADDIVMCHDLSTLTNPEWHEPAVGRLYDEAFRRILEAGPQVIAVSRNTADTLYANFGRYPNRVTVVHNYLPQAIGRGAAGAAPALRPAAPYFLFVGSLEARKNVVGAIDAFALSGLGQEGYRLYIVGGRGYGAEAIERRAVEVPGVALLGYMKGAALSALYAAATGFFYPSYLEGFGVPLLEAMAFGLPAVVTSCGASPEVGGDLMRYCDPDDHQGMAEELRAVTRLKPEERECIAARLRERALGEFGFARFRERLLETIAATVRA
jgi:glycosyltransferase involved in cell wall biosynthesis